MCYCINGKLFNQQRIQTNAKVKSHTIRDFLFANEGADLLILFNNAQLWA
uniref:Uncharacterized protein n=1 Tax=Arion vulgaris TaxID=1028688 RepID=A0A0B6ZPT4_9EUPU